MGLRSLRRGFESLRARFTEFGRYNGLRVLWGTGVRGMKRGELIELMQTLDDAWNKQDWPVFRKRHADEFRQTI